MPPVSGNAVCSPAATGPKGVADRRVRCPRLPSSATRTAISPEPAQAVSRSRPQRLCPSPCCTRTPRISITRSVPTTVTTSGRGSSHRPVAGSSRSSGTIPRERAVLGVRVVAGASRSGRPTTSRDPPATETLTTIAALSCPCRATGMNGTTPWTRSPTCCSTPRISRRCPPGSRVSTPASYARAAPERRPATVSGIHTRGATRVASATLRSAIS